MKKSSIIYFFAILLLMSCSEKQQSGNNVRPPSDTQKITFDSTSWTYQASIIENNSKKTLQFLTYPVDSTRQVYSEMRYYSDTITQWSDTLTPRHISNSQPTLVLANELPVIKRLWDTLKGKVNIDLRGVSIGNPKTYKDALNNYISLLQTSPEWTNQINKKNANDYRYSLVEGILKTGNVYQPLDSLLETYGYSIDYYHTEKHHFLSKDFLKRHGYDSTLLIPMPMMFGIGVKRQD